MASYRRLLKLFAVCVFAALNLSIFSCTKEDVNALPEGEFRIVTALAPDAYPSGKVTKATMVGLDEYADASMIEDTKTYLSEDFCTVEWYKGDVMAAYSVDDEKVSAANENENGTTAHFKLKNTSYKYAYYPGGKTSTLSGSTLTVTGGFPSSQTATKDSFGNGDNLMVADASKTSGWKFYNAGALISFTLAYAGSTPLSVSSVKLTNKGTASYMSGDAAVSFSDGSISGVSIPSGGSKSVAYTGQFNIGPTPETYSLVVAPGTYGGTSGGLEIEIACANGEKLFFRNDNELVLDKNDNKVIAKFTIPISQHASISSSINGGATDIGNNGSSFTSTISGTVNGVKLYGQTVTYGVDYGTNGSLGKTKSASVTATADTYNFSIDVNDLEAPAVYYKTWASLDGGTTKVYASDIASKVVTAEITAAAFTPTAKTTVDIDVTGGSVTIGGYKGTVSVTGVEFYDNGSPVQTISAGTTISATSVGSTGFNFTASSAQGAGFNLPASNTSREYYVRVKFTLGSHAASATTTAKYATANSAHNSDNVQRYTNMRGEGGSGTGQNVWDFGTEMRYNIVGTTYAGPCSGTKDVYLYYDSASGSSSTDWKEVFHYTTNYYVGKSGLTGDSSAQTVWNARTSALTSHSIDIKRVCYGLKISPDGETAGVMGFEITGYDTLTLGSN